MEGSLPSSSQRQQPQRQEREQEQRRGDLKHVWSQWFGCSHNRADTELMNGILVKNGWTLVDTPSEAEWFLVNSCTVKDPSEQHAVNVVQKCLDDGMCGVFAGCVAQTSQLTPNLELAVKQGRLAVLGTTQCHRILEAFASIDWDETRGCGLIAKADPSDRGSCTFIDAFPRAPLSPIITVVPVCSGCLCCCTYCKTVEARGKLISQPLESIQSIVRGRKGEIWLTGEDVGAWGTDLPPRADGRRPSYSDMLFGVVAAMGPDAMLRLGMSNPGWVQRDIDKVCEVFLHPAVFKFIHLPVQTGSDSVLKRMKRPYNIHQFKELVRTLRERIPDIVISTDWIVGFPGETDEEFEETMNLAQELKFEVANISHYYARPKTPAKYMPGRVPTDIVKARSRRLTRATLDGFKRDRYIGKRFHTLITEARIKPLPSLCARTSNYLQIVIPAPDLVSNPSLTVSSDGSVSSPMIGRWVNVEIIRATRVALEGRILPEDAEQGGRTYEIPRGSEESHD